MESWQSAPYEPAPPPPPPSPPQLWLQRSSVSENEIISKHMKMELRQSSPDQLPAPQPSYGNLNEQLATRAGCTIPRYRSGNGYLNQGKGYNVEHIGKETGRGNENFETRNRFGIGCNVEYFGKGTGRANGNVDMFNNVDPDITRALEKQKIREEIIAGEIARRQELEAEVREELRIEREMALRMKRGNVFDGVHVSIVKSPMQEVERPSLEDNVARPIEESLRIQGRTQTSGTENIVKPFQQTSLESKVTEIGQEKEKNIFLAKPSADLPAADKEESVCLVAAKESAYTVFGVWGVGNIEGKKVWRCFICQVSATSEADLKQHFTGSKHRSKRAVLKAEKIAATAIAGETVQMSGNEPLMPTPPPPIATAKPLDGNKNKEKGKFASWCEMGTGEAYNKYLMKARIEPLKTTLPEKKKEKKEKKKAVVKEDFAFWCEMCNAGANNKYLMEAHKKGKKHLEKLQEKFPFWCDMCKVGAQVAHIMEAHLKGRKHLTALQEKAASTTSEQGNLASKIV